jgi:hypothetical protein
MTANAVGSCARSLKVLGCGIALAAALGSGSAFAGEHRFTVLLDTDNNALTGCSVVTAKGVAPGIEQAWTTVVTTTAAGATVTRIERQTCAGGTLGAPTVFATAGWSAGLGNGTSGTAALETYVPLADLPTQGSMKVWVASTNATGGQDATAPFVVALGGNSGPGNSGVTAVPLSPWLVLPLGFLMLVGVAWLRRWQPERVSLVLCAVIIAASGLVWAAKVTLDGNIGDWQGIAPVAGNAKGSAPIDANIVGVFYQSDSSNLYFRIDADVRADAAGNQPPVVSAGADQTITLPAVANLSGTASDDGLPNPPGKLTLTWSMVSGALPVSFADASAASTTATFFTPGSYTLRLTAFDGALNSSSDTHVTVNSSAPLLGAIADRTIPLGTHVQIALGASDGNVLDTLAFSLPVAPAGAALNPPPVIDWTPTAAQLGSNAFTAKVTNVYGQSAMTTFHITVTPANRPPVLAAQADVTLPVGVTFSRTLSATDPDAGDTLTFALVSGPPGMTLSGANLNWSTAGDAASDYAVIVRVTDSHGAFDAKLFIVTLTPSSPPVANDDNYQVILGNTLSVPAAGVLGNDFNPIVGALSATKLTDPDKGTLNAFNADGSFIYQAPAVLQGPIFAPVVKYHVDTLLFTDPPLVADVDGDGKPELIFLGVGGSAAEGITAVRGTDGSVLWNTPVLPAPDGDCTAGLFTAGNFYHLALGDIDDSGQLSIVFPTSCGRDNLPTQIVGTNVARYAALNAKDGSLKWLSPPLSRELDANGNPANLASGTVPTLARVRVGETPSIVVGLDASYFFFNGKPECDQLIAGWPANVACRGVIVLDGKDGSVRQRMAAPIAGSYDLTTYGNGTQAAVVADLAGDGNIEFIFGGAVFNNDGSIRWNNTDNGLGEPLSFWNGVANFDDTPDIEIARLEGNGSGSGPDRLTVYKSDGSKLWWLPLPGTAYTSLPVIADVDGTGRPAVVLAVGGNVCAVDYQGTYKWCHDVGAPGGVSNVSLGSRVQVYDLEGTGVPEVIVAVNGEVLLFLDGQTGNVKSSLDMGAANGPPFAPFPQSGVGGPVVADLDGSGHAAIATLWYGPLGPRLDVVAAQNNDWRPIRKIFNQESYQFGNVNDDGTIPQTFVNNFATQATNVFGAQPQLLTPVDPRLRTQTSFSYQADNGLLSSSPATVTIDILPTNRPPVFVSTPPTRYVGQSAFSYTAHAIDPDPGDTVTYSLQLGQGNGPNVFGNCTMGPSTGVLSCGILFAGEQDFIIVATDSQGASVYQNVRLQESPGPAAVPDVVNETQAAAGTTLTGAGFTTGPITKIFNAAPAGQVIAQAPSGGTSALLGEAIALSISQGPAPVAVPFVEGDDQASALPLLTSDGFTVSVTNVFSNTVPANQVIAQSPSAGTMLAPTPANPVALTVSAGSGLALRLNSSVILAGTSLPLVTVAIDLSGNETPFGNVAYSIASVAGTSGANPVVNSGAFVTDLTTRGSYLITATEIGGSGRTAQADVIVQPPDANPNTPYWGLQARFGEALAAYTAAVPALQKAALANDKAAMLALVQPLQAKLALANLPLLATIDSGALESGFLPTMSDLEAAGLQPTAEDDFYIATTLGLTALLQQIVAELDPADSTSVQKFSADLLQAEHLADLLIAAHPTVVGLAGAHPAMAAISASFVPQILAGWLNALASTAAKSKMVSPKISLPSLILAAVVLVGVASAGFAVYHRLVGNSAASFAQLIQIQNLAKSTWNSGAVVLPIITGNTSVAKYLQPNTIVDANGVAGGSTKVGANFSVLALAAADQAATQAIINTFQQWSAQVNPPQNAQAAHAFFTNMYIQVLNTAPVNANSNFLNVPTSVGQCSSNPNPNQCASLTFNNGLVAHIPCVATFLACVEQTILIVWDQDGGSSVSDHFDMLPGP